MTRLAYVLALFCFIDKAYMVPPWICLATFRDDDCGKPPEPVIYYYKPGSRCEVRLWRGCLPNPNMFPDEHECISTCIHGYHHVEAPDYHIPEDYEENLHDICLIVVFCQNEP